MVQCVRPPAFLHTMFSGVRHCAMFVGSGLPLCLLLWLAASRLVFRGVLGSFQLCIHIPSPRIPLYAFVYIYIYIYTYLCLDKLMHPMHPMYVLTVWWVCRYKTSMLFLHSCFDWRRECEMATSHAEQRREAANTEDGRPPTV